MSADSSPVDPAAEAATVDFVELFNARDWDAVAELLDESVTSDSLDAASRQDVIEALSDLDVQYPGLVVTRGELGDEPVVVAWLPDFETKDWYTVGYFSFSFTDGDEPLIEHIEYEQVPSDDEQLLAEEPDEGDLPEWFDWTEYEEGAPSIDEG